jgi:hypothetical protein
MHPSNEKAGSDCQLDQFRQGFSHIDFGRRGCTRSWAFPAPQGGATHAAEINIAALSRIWQFNFRPLSKAN